MIMVASAMQLLLHNMPNNVLAAANSVINGFGYIPPMNVAFDYMLNANLIDEEGRPLHKEWLLAALNAELTLRLNSGTFV